MKSWRQLGWRIVVSAALLGLAVAVPQPASGQQVTAATPPAGRANYTVALMRDVGTTSFVRLAQYSLRADGTARADYWAWNAQTLQPRTSAGYTTSGCAYTCQVWTTNGFQNAAQQLYGTWSTAGNDLSITWTSGSSGTERWKFSNLATITQVTLASHPTATDGFGWGSTVSFTTGVPVSTIYAGHGLYSGPFVQNNYGTRLRSVDSLRIYHVDPYITTRLCNANCINLTTTNEGVVSDKKYLAGSGTNRKMFYNHQRATVNSATCIGGGSSTGAGHLKPSLQIIDDAGKFRGLIMVEASLYAYAYGSNILGIFDLNDI